MVVLVMNSRGLFQAQYGERATGLEPVVSGPHLLEQVEAGVAGMARRDVDSTWMSLSGKARLPFERLSCCLTSTWICLSEPVSELLPLTACAALLDRFPFDLPDLLELLACVTGS